MATKESFDALSKLQSEKRLFVILRLSGGIAWKFPIKTKLS